MINPIPADRGISGLVNLTVYRAPTGQGGPLSAPATPKSSTASNNGQFSKHERQDRYEPPSEDRSSDFAAAVIAGALPPTPQTMEQLIMRIGASTIPEESQARLKDLLA